MMQQLVRQTANAGRWRLWVVLTGVAALIVSMVPLTSAEAEPTSTALVRATLYWESQPADAVVGEPVSSVRFAASPAAPAPAIGITSAPILGTAFDAEVRNLEGLLRADLVAKLEAAGANVRRLERDIDAAVAAAEVRARMLDAASAAAPPVVVTFARNPGAAPPDIDVVQQGARAVVNGLTPPSGRGYVLNAASTASATSVPLPVLQTSSLTVRVRGVATSISGRLTDRTLPLETAAVVSNWFSVYDGRGVQRCSGSSVCEVTQQQRDRLRANVTAQGADGAVLVLGFSGEQLCSGIDYQGLPEAVLVDGKDIASQKTVTLTIDRSIVQLDRDNGRAQYDLCYRGDAPFTAKDGTSIGAPNSDAEPGDPLRFGPALLPDCGPAQQAVPPCIASRTGSQGGDVTLVVRLPAGDPWMR